MSSHSRNGKDANSDSKQEPSFVEHLRSPYGNKEEAIIVQKTAPVIQETFKAMTMIAQPNDDGSAKETTISLWDVCHQLSQTSGKTTQGLNLKRAALALQSEGSPWLDMKLTLSMNGKRHLALKGIEFDAERHQLAIRTNEEGTKRHLVFPEDQKDGKANGNSNGKDNGKGKPKDDADYVDSEGSDDEVQDVTSSNKSTKYLEVELKPEDNDENNHRIRYHLYGIGVNTKVEPAVDNLVHLFIDEIDTQLIKADVLKEKIDKAKGSRKTVLKEDRNKVIARVFKEGSVPMLQLYKGRPGNLKKQARFSTQDPQPTSILKVEVISRLTSWLQITHEIYMEEWFETVGADEAFLKKLQGWAGIVREHLRKNKNGTPTP